MQVARLLIAMAVATLTAYGYAASEWDVHPTPLETLENLGYQPTYETAMSILADPTQKAEVRATAALALAQLDNNQAVPLLAAATKDPQVDVRSNAAWALGVLPSADNTRILEDVLESDADSEPRTAALIALRRIGTIEAASAMLVAAFNEEESDSNRLAAISGVAEIGNSSQVDSLEGLTTHDSAAIRNKASMVLVAQGNSEYLDEVVTIALDRGVDYFTYLEAIEALESQSGEDFGNPTADPPEAARQKIDSWWKNRSSELTLKAE